MDVDHVTYIFGSVSRRRQSDDATAAKRRSLDPQPANAASSPPPPQAAATTTTMTIRSPVRAVVSAAASRAVCGICRRAQTEPRLLACLHSFCTDCLMELHAADAWSDPADSVFVGGSAEDASGSGSGSGSGCGEARSLQCPVCGLGQPLPAGGVRALPPDFPLLSRLRAATAPAAAHDDQDAAAAAAQPFCDLCSTNVQASCRCADCVSWLCAFCAEAHSRQRATSAHALLPLGEARRLRPSAAGGATSARRPAASCALHPGQELRLFCATCARPVCRDCEAAAHRGHTVEAAARAAQLCARGLRDALERARPVAEQAAQALDRLGHLEKRIQTRCSQVSDEVERFIESYSAALEEHRRSLQRQIQEARAAKLQLVEAHARQLHSRADQAATAVAFTDDLLAEGSDVELLTLVSPVLRRLEWCCNNGANGSLMEPQVSDCLQFLPEEGCGRIKSHTLFGVITTQTVSPQHCTLNTDTLMICRQHKKAEAVLTTRDADEQPLCHGGEKVTAELRYKDASNRKIPIHVADRRDGTYLLVFVPDTAGNLSLSIYVRGKPIKGSPFLVCVRTLRPHHGTFHCCSFCSSNGSKTATCGCGGKMPGGYQGCGHGHAGHPGRRHWSCCGNILENSECGRTNSALYQFSL